MNKLEHYHEAKRRLQEAAVEYKDEKMHLSLDGDGFTIYTLNDSGSHWSGCRVGYEQVQSLFDWLSNILQEDR